MATYEYSTYSGWNGQSYSWGTGQTQCWVGAYLENRGDSTVRVYIHGAVHCHSYYGLSQYGVHVYAGHKGAEGVDPWQTPDHRGDGVFDGNSDTWLPQEYCKTYQDFPRKSEDYEVEVYCGYYGETVNGYGPCKNSGSVSTKIKISAKNEYTITYDANGGINAPFAQTKTYGVDLTLSSTKPQRTGYFFLGWSRSPVASEDDIEYPVSSLDNAVYSGNSDLTLYAVWELAKEKPLIPEIAIKETCPLEANASGITLLCSYNCEDDINKSINKLIVTQKKPIIKHTAYTGEEIMEMKIEKEHSILISPNEQYVISLTALNEAGETKSKDFRFYSKPSQIKDEDIISSYYKTIHSSSSLLTINLNLSKVRVPIRQVTYTLTNNRTKVFTFSSNKKHLSHNIELNADEKDAQIQFIELVSGDTNYNSWGQKSDSIEVKKPYQTIIGYNFNIQTDESSQENSKVNIYSNNKNITTLTTGISFFIPDE